MPCPQPILDLLKRLKQTSSLLHSRSTVDMKSVAQRMQDLTPIITEILRVSGGAGASVGIIHQGQVHTAGFGYRDIPNQLVPDENTSYHLASLSKSFAAAGIGILVHQEKLTWNHKISQILPDFNHPDPAVQNDGTVLDFLAHRTGLATKNALWQQDGHELLLEHKDLLSTVSYSEVVAPLRSRWIYNNWNYDIASEIIETVTGMPYAEFLAQEILSPLGLHDTVTALNPPKLENWAHGYMPSPDCKSTDVGRPVISDGTIMQGANGIKSTVADLLKYYKATLDAWKQETGKGGSSNTPFKNVKDLLSEHIPIEEGSEFGQWYGAGWAMADLPAPLGSIGTNGMFVEMPTVGKGSKKTRVWYHNGSLVGFFSSVHVIPETDTIIVILTNSITKNDCADWLGQLVLEDLLDVPEKNNYVSLATESARVYDQMWDELEATFQKPGPDNPNPRLQSEYVGKYYNKPKNWFIQVVESDGSLHFSFQGRSTQRHHLRPHGQDVFSWPLTEKESRHIGRWPDLDEATYLFRFGANDAGKIDKLVWVHDPDVPEGESFIKEEPQKARDEL